MVMKKYFTLTKATIISLTILIGFNLPTTSYALTLEQKTLYNQNILYYDLETNCSPTASQATAVSPGSGAPDGLQFPNLDPQKMADAINTYIEETAPDSRMKGFGSTIVASAENSNISPFLIVGIAQKESGIGDPGFGDGWNVRNANNSFGRSATASQPHRVGAKFWYYWTSIRASVDHKAPENINANGGGDIASYIRDEYDAQLNSNDIDTFMHRYAPPRDNNDTVGYIRSLKVAIGKMVELAGATATSAGQSTIPQTPTSSACCASTPSTTVNGEGNKQIVWNYLVSTMGFSNLQAAGIMGNIEQESNFRTDVEGPVVDGKKAYGLAQWYAGRRTALESYASSVNKPVSDLNMQLDFLAKELNDDYKVRVLDPIKASNNLAEVTRIWLERFEVPCTPGSTDCDREMNIRLPNAESFLREFGNGGAVIAVTDSLTCGTTTGQAITEVTLRQLPTYLSSPGGTITPKGITLHWWGSNGDGGIDFLTRALRGNQSCGAGGCSVQLGITKEGDVYQMTSSLTDLTYHAAGANSTTIGIEIEGGPADFGAEGITRYPQKFEAVVATVKMLMEKYNIPATGSAQCGNVSGIHPHKAYNGCSGQTKSDIDDFYFNKVIEKVRQ